MQNHQSGLSWKPKSLAVHVERELSFWKSTLSERSKGWLSPEILPHKGKKWPSFPGLVQEWAWSLSWTFLWGFKVYPKKQAGLEDSCTSTPGPMLSFSNAFQEAFATARVSESWRWQGPPASQTTPLAMSMGSPTVRVKHVLHLSCCPSFTSVQEESPQQPINPFQTRLGSHMCFLVAWFLARETALILLLDLCACLLFIMCELNEWPWTGERENNDCHIVSSSLQAKGAVWTFP